MNQVQEEARGSRRKSLILTGCIVWGLALLIVFVLLHGWPEKTDVSFEWLVKPTYEDAWPFQDGLARVETEKMRFWALIDREGNIVKDDLEAVIIFPYSKEGLALAWFSKRKGERKEKDFVDYIMNTQKSFLNKSGDIIAPMYERANPFSSGLAAVQKNDKYGFIDTEGKLAIPF